MEQQEPRDCIKRAIGKETNASQEAIAPVPDDKAAHEAAEAEQPRPVAEVEKSDRERPTTLEHDEDAGRDSFRK
jgi:hypothetical protein